jgi:hypothetical protein
MMEDAAPVDGEEEPISDSMPTREEVLAEVGKWYALEPANEAIHLGLLRLQGVTYREIYRQLRGEPNVDSWKSQKQVLVRLWSDKFLALAKSRGLPAENLQKLVNHK